MPDIVRRNKFGLRWWKWRNVGYMRLPSQGSIEVFLDFLRKDAEKHRSTWRLWHTRRLIVMWETEGNQVVSRA